MLALRVNRPSFRIFGCLASQLQQVKHELALVFRALNGGLSSSERETTSPLMNLTVAILVIPLSSFICNPRMGATSIPGACAPFLFKKRCKHANQPSLYGS
jgi:hypothetical protein